MSPENPPPAPPPPRYTEDLSDEELPFEKYSEPVPSIKKAVDVEAIRRKLQGKRKQTEPLEKPESRRKLVDYDEDEPFPTKSSLKHVLPPPPGKYFDLSS